MDHSTKKAGAKETEESSKVRLLEHVQSPNFDSTSGNNEISSDPKFNTSSHEYRLHQGSAHEKKYKRIKNPCLRCLYCPFLFIMRRFESGSINSSVFSLVQVILGAGILTFPYCFMQNGIIPGLALLLVGGLMSGYTGVLLVKASDYTKYTKYEDIAHELYGRTWALAATILFLLALLSANISYTVYMQTAIPNILNLFIDVEKDLPEYMRENPDGHKFWGAVISFVLLFPMSIARKVNALRYTSAFGVTCSIYLMIVVTLIFWADRTQVPKPLDNLGKVELFKFSTFGLFSTLPLIVFAFMYQFNVPIIYKELRNRSPERMNQVLLRGMIIAAVAYIFTGIFGYATFVNNAEEDLKSENILDAPYNNLAISIGLVSQFFSIFTAYPVLLLPCKDTIEQLIYGKRGNRVTDSVSGSGKMGPWVNVLVTFGLVAVTFTVAITLTSIGDALTIVGSTITPTAGYLMPAAFYLKSTPDKPWFSKEKIMPVLVSLLIVVTSVISLVNFFMYKEG